MASAAASETPEATEDMEQFFDVDYHEGVLSLTCSSEQFASLLETFARQPDFGGASPDFTSLHEIRIVNAAGAEAPAPVSWRVHLGCGLAALCLLFVGIAGIIQIVRWAFG